MKQLEPGTRFGSYQIEKCIGRGGMGIVYLAEHLGLARRVALKTLDMPDESGSPLVERFLREGKLASRIVHPNVVEVYDVGVQQGLPYLVMEYLEGRSLGDVLATEGTFSVTAALDVFLPVCAAIQEAHDVGVVHRDLKPDNIFLAVEPRNKSTVPKVLDFGISVQRTARAGEHALTQTGEVIGTVDYMSPEHLEGARNVVPKSDQFALGIVLYEMLTLQLPYGPEPTLQTVMHALWSGEMLPPSHFRSDLPPALEALILRAISHRKEQRFPSVRAFARELLPFANPSTATKMAKLLIEPDDVESTNPQPNALLDTLHASASVASVSIAPAPPPSEPPVPVVKPSVPLRSRTSSSQWKGAVLGGVLGLGALGIWMFLRHRDSPTTTSAQAITPESQLDAGSRSTPTATAQVPANDVVVHVQQPVVTNVSAPTTSSDRDAELTQAQTEDAGASAARPRINDNTAPNQNVGRRVLIRGIETVDHFRIE